MSTEQNRTENASGGASSKKSNKITPIRFPYDASDDPVIDDFLLDNMQEEADEIERRMNSDPGFVKATGEEADEQYAKIVARLKKMGVWEEENGEEKESEEKRENREEQKNVEKLEISEDPESRKRQETKGNPERKERQENRENLKGIEEQETLAEEADLDEVYYMLSKDDRQALELGRRELRRQQRKKARSARLLRVARRGGVVAAAFVLLFAVSMNVDASRRVILRMWDSMTDVLATRTATNNLEDSVQSTMAESLAAMAQIEEATGIPGLNFAYWPDGMEYLQYELQDENTEAYVFFTYDEKILQVYMRNIYEDSSNYLMTDQDAVLVEKLESWSGAEVRIWSVNPDSDVEQYQAEFEYEAFRYVLYGYISLEELERLVKGMDFLA
ncbi:MAG: DUF4367 domain-containing protein [Lachnospiraceae bacterium]|nr:DUF4367 domain-containing protein [Lachnospiraceae bacterium]